MSVVSAENSSPKGMSRRVKLNAQDWMIRNYAHPYNQKINKFLCCFAHLIRHIKPEEVDLELAWGHGLVNGELQGVPFDSTSGLIQNYLVEHRSDIRRQVYTALADWLMVMTKIFDRTQFKADDDYANDCAWDSRWSMLDLGHTIKLPKATREILESLIKFIQTTSFERDWEWQQLEYNLDMAMTSVKDANKRYERVLNDIIYDDTLDDHPQVTGQTRLVSDYAVPLLSVIPQNQFDHSLSVPSEVVMNSLTPRKLKIYSSIFGLLACLRLVRMEGEFAKYLPSWMVSGDPRDKDPYAQHGYDVVTEQWLDHLPTYHPSFVLLLKERKNFTYAGSHRDPHSDCSVALAYLRAMFPFI